MQQQHEKKRKKRDYVSNPSAAPLRELFTQVAPGAEAHGHPHYRDTASGSFPDPLFKEQWYLVSIRLSCKVKLLL